MTLPHLSLSIAFRARFAFMLALCLLLLAACSAAPQSATLPELTGQAAEAVQAANGLVVVRAEQFQANKPRGNHSWKPQKDTNSPTGAALVASPDINVGVNSSPNLTSPQLDYRVRFVKAGTHYVWVYGQAPAQATLNGDSLHIGLNGQAPASSSRIGDFKRSYGWINLKMAGGPATLQIPKPGVYTLNVWMREDGARFSAVALSSDPRFRPSQATVPVAQPQPVASPQPVVSLPTQKVEQEAVAFSASALRSSVGINIHSLYSDTAYYDTPRLLSYLKDLEPTWVREGVHQQPRPWHPGFLRDLKKAGFKLNVGIGDPAGSYGNFGIGDSQNLVRSLKTTYAGLYDQLEMPNEWDLFARNDNWLSELNAFYDEFYRAIRSDTSLRGVRVVGPSFGRGQSAAEFARDTEVTNIHPYSGGLMPENSDIVRIIADARSKSSSRQVVATELGYHTAFNTNDGFRGVPEDIAGHYLIRNLIWNYAQGVEQNYIYQLFDQKPDNPQRTEKESWFGLVAVEGNPNASITTWKLRKKPAFYAVKRFQAYLQDSGQGSLPSTLPFEAQNLPQNALMLPIARKDGTYDIAIWLQNSLWERNSRTLVADSSGTASFRFASSVNVSSFRPSVGDAVTQVGTGVTELSVPIDGKVTFFRVRP